MSNAATAVTSQSPGLSVEDVFGLVDLVGAALSTNGKTVVYVSSAVDDSHDRDLAELWTVDVEDASATNLRVPLETMSAPSISPSGESVAFLGKADSGLPQIYVCGLDGRNLTQVTHLAGGAGSVGPRWSPDGRTIAFDGHMEYPRDPRKPYRVTRPLWRRDGIGVVDDHSTDLFLVSSSGGEPRRLTRHDGMITSFEWSRDGHSIAYVSLAEPDSLKQFVRVVEIRTGSFRTLDESDFLIYPPVASWLPDGRLVCSTRFDVSRELDLVVIDPNTGNRESRAPRIGGQLFGLLTGVSRAALAPTIVVNEDGTAAYVQVQRGGRSEVDRVALRGTVDITAVADGNRACYPLAISGNRLLLAASDFQNPLDLNVLNTEDGSETQLTHLNETLLAHCPKLSVHDLHFRGEDGTSVEGWFIEPAGDAPAPFATVVHLHGGPFAGQGHIFNLTNHVLVGSGFGVLMINFRGSSGYGDDFARTLHGDWGHYDYSDVMAGIDHAVEAGLADPKRLASFGASGGGYMTAWNLTHTDRFRAGVAQCPAVGFCEMVASDICTVMEEWAGSAPGSGVDEMRPYLRASPNTYASNCKTPLLIIVHELDVRCPTNQADVLYNTLKLAGSTVEMLRLPGISHGGLTVAGNPLARFSCVEAVRDWIHRYLS